MAWELFLSSFSSQSNILQSTRKLNCEFLPSSNTIFKSQTVPMLGYTESIIYGSASLGRRGACLLTVQKPQNGWQNEATVELFLPLAAMTLEFGGRVDLLSLLKQSTINWAAWTTEMCCLTVLEAGHSSQGCGRVVSAGGGEWRTCPDLCPWFVDDHLLPTSPHVAFPLWEFVCKFHLFTRIAVTSG